MRGDLPGSDWRRLAGTGGYFCVCFLLCFPSSQCFSVHAACLSVSVLLQRSAILLNCFFVDLLRVSMFWQISYAFHCFWYVFFVLSMFIRKGFYVSLCCPFFAIHFMLLLHSQSFLVVFDGSEFELLRFYILLF